MDDDLIPYLEKLVTIIEKDIAKFKSKEDASMLMKPYAEWTEADEKHFFSTTTEQRLAESDKWMHKRIDAEFALNNLQSIIYLRRITGSKR